MKKLFILLISFCVTFLLVLSGLRPPQYDIAPGRTAPQDIYAPRETVDTVTTEKRRAEAEEALKPQYDIFEDVTESCDKKLSEILAFAENVRGAETEIEASTAEGVDISALLSMDDATFSSFSAFLLSTQNQLLADGIVDRAEALEKARSLLSSYPRHVETGLSILEQTLQENKFYNPDKTNEARQTLRNSVEEVTYKANQVIVRKGDIITPAQFAVLSSLGMVASDSQKLPWYGGIGAFFLLLACYGILYLYMRRYAGECLKNDGLLLLVAIIFALTVLLSSTGISKTVSPYILPIITGTALLAILLDIRFAITYNAVISILSVLFFRGDIYCLACFLLSGTLSTFIFTRPGLRHTLVFSALLQSLAQFAIYLSMGILEGLSVQASFLRGIYGLGAGLISSVLLIGTLPFWEYCFDVTTPFKLLELSNPDQPLLKRLLTEAPGTYHHSLMVGNLAESASEAIGCNGLLARTGAYYHDVGKLRRPQYYKENQYAENPHDKMDPALSASVILSHVKDGVELARQHRLPGAIRSIIASHHGTSLISFFYHKAQIENEGEAEEENFRYKGPRPGTKEEAVVMLADSVEAAVRSLENKDETSVREMVHKILEGRLSDGQLGESGLTLRDVEMIETAFVHTCSGYFHSRIPYPEANKKEE